LRVVGVSVMLPARSTGSAPVCGEPLHTSPYIRRAVLDPLTQL